MARGSSVASPVERGRPIGYGRLALQLVRPPRHPWFIVDHIIPLMNVRRTVRVGKSRPVQIDRFFPAMWPGVSGDDLEIAAIVCQKAATFGAADHHDVLRAGTELSWDEDARFYGETNA